ncbi:MAG: hypothetical protein M1531_09165 [Chloroflexi bacterium]|nr:hypothetical protein [Chloroflexota bacterium]
MAVAVKPLADIANKWSTETPRRSSYYEQGVRNPTKDWAGSTQASASNFKAAVSAGDIDKRFSGGVRRAGTAKWQRKAVDVGASRYGPGVTAAAGDYQAGMAPMIETLAQVNLPPRRPRGDPGNLDRVKAVADALSKRRLALAASGS